MTGHTNEHHSRDDDPAVLRMPDAESQEGIEQRDVRSRVWDVLNSWDRGIDNTSEHVGDAITAGFRSFFGALFKGKKPERDERHHHQSA